MKPTFEDLIKDEIKLKKQVKKLNEKYRHLNRMFIVFDRIIEYKK